MPSEIEFILDGKGRPKPIFENVIRLLIHDNQFNLRYDDFAMRPCFGDELLEDRHLRMICRWVQAQGIPAGTSVIQEAIVTSAETRRFHPVRQYLDALVWDQTPRLDALFIEHGGAADTPINRAMTGKWFVQAVARIYQPGCQADAMIILESPQGRNKSTFFRVMFGSRWFSDHLPALESKDSLIQLRGLWCIEVAELATLGRADANRIKQFLTSRFDRYRDPYGRLAIDYPRTCVFAGTVNPGGSDGYLKDPTGARRFWPIPVEKIDVGLVEKVRDQLWAEAKVRYDAGEQWWLPQALVGEAELIQADRFEDDPWSDKVAEYVVGKSHVMTAEILKHALHIEKAGDWTRSDQIRVARILTQNNWVRRKERFGSKTHWVYFRQDPTQSKDDLLDDPFDDPFK
jgi:predicted P-loop ATPase